MHRLSALLLIVLLAAPPLSAGGRQEEPSPTPEPSVSGYEDARKNMVQTQLENRDIEDPAVLEAMRKVPRHRFIPEELRSQAYDDHPVRIGEGQTISQPYIVALMTQSLELTGDERVLEIGTGSGYQAAVLAEIVAEVYSIEIKEVLAQRSREVLDSPGYGGVKTKWDDGYFGWPEYAPFDRIIITAAVDHVPPPLLEQLIDGGLMVLPLGDPYGYQQLAVVHKNEEGFTVRHITGVLFVPMTGKARGE